ncbi:hypothetical protein BN1110_05366 [bacterium YEK0313]|nr:hypothetical protein BN1110_05366 [bacterium YEK0313]
MTSSRAALGLVAFALAFVPAAHAQTDALPRQVEIAEDFGTYLCPSESAGRQMAGHLQRADIAGGYRATGCRARPDRSGTIRITEVLQRFRVEAFNPPQTYMLYRGTAADGRQVIGLVGEEGNDRHPRDALGYFLRDATRDGMIEVDTRNPAYVCPDGVAAAKVVVALADRARGAAPTARRTALLQQALAANGCSPAAGRYRVTALHQRQQAEPSLEAEEDWVALSATDRDGRTVGLLYNTATHD